MAATWEVSSGTVTYKNEQGNTLFTVSGLKTDGLTSGESIEGLSFSGTKVTVANSLLPTSGTVSVSSGYTLELSGATEWSEGYQLGAFSIGTVPINLHQTEGWKADDENNATSYTWTAAEADELLATITLTNSSASNKDGLSLDGTVVTVGLEPFNQTAGVAATTVSINNTGGVTFTLLAGLGTVPANNATIDDPAWDSTTSKITQHYSAWYSAGSNQITYTPEKTETLATLTGFTGEAPTIDKTDKTLTVTTANVDTSSGNTTLTIGGNGGYKLVLSDTDDNPTDGKVGFEEVAAQWVTGSTANTFDYKSGYTKEGWEQASDTSITYRATTKSTGDDYKTLTTLTNAGLASGVDAAALNDGGATVDTTATTVTLDSSVLNSGAAENDAVTASGDYKISIAEDQRFDHDAANQTLSVAANSDNAIITRAQNAGWTGNSTNEIKYKSEVSALTLATITGVKLADTGVTVDNTAETVAGKTIVTLAADALKSDQSDTYTITIQDNAAIAATETFKGFKLTLAEGIQTTEVDDDTATEVKMTLDTSAGTATVKKNKKEYWDGANTTTITYHPEQEGAGDEVAKITGLATGITDSNVELDAANSKITLKDGALKKTTATAAGAGATLISDTYSVELDSSVTQDADKYETDPTKGTLNLTAVKDGDGNITGYTATVNKNQKEYWTLNTDGDSKTVTYHAAEDGDSEDPVFATVEGLSKDATSTNVTVDPSTQKITLKDGALNKGSATAYTVSVTGDGGYTFVLDSTDGTAVNTNNAKDNGTVTMTVAGVGDDGNGNATSKTATVKKDYAEYWTLGGESKTVTYKPKNSGAGDSVAEITGLATTATNEGETPNVTLAGTTITLNKAALKDSDATVTLTGYTVELGDDVIDEPTDEEDDTKVTLNLAEVTEGGNTTKTATVNRDEQKYWTVESGKVEFHAASPGTGTKVAEVTGLATTAVKDTNVILDGTTITLKKDALPSTTSGTKATLTVGSGTYTLAKGTDAPASSATYGAPTLDLTEISNGGKATYKRTPSAGWDLSGNEITYTVPADETLAVITGLKTDATAAAISLNANTGVITLKKAALNETDNNEVKFTDNTAGYTFALPDTVARYATTASTFAVGTVDANGEATITATVSKGWTFGTNNKSLTYHDATSDVVVAKITGLNTGAESGDVTINSGTGVVTLKKGALPTTAGTKVKLVSYDAVADDGVDTSKYIENFTLAIDGATAEGKLGYENTGYWTKKGTTAKYYETAMEGWAVGDTKREITYEEAQSTAGTNPIVTIENLTRSLTLGKVTGSDGIKRDVIGTGTYSETAGENTFVAGVSIKDKEITLNKNVLGTEAAMTVALGTGYTLKLNDDENDPLYVLGEQTAANVWTYGVTTTYKNVDLEYWTYNDTDTITYHPQVENATLATITGLKGTVGADDLADTEAYTGSIGDVTAKGTITLNKDALNKRDVVINSNYYGLALNSDSADTGKYVAPPNPSNQAWSISGTVATYKANVMEEGYTAASDGSSVTYTATATGDNKVTLATVSGLKSGLTDSDLSTGLTFGAAGTAQEKEITVASNLVGTSNIEVTGTNYTLKLEADHTNGIYLADDPEVTTGVDVWRVDGTTATYKKVKFANYEIANEGKSIVYTPEADVELTKTETDATTGETTTTKVADKTIFATVEGLKSGLTAGFDTSDNSTWVGVDNAGTVSKELELNSNAIVLTAGALGTTGVTLTNGAAATEAGTTYELSLGDSAAEEALAPHMSDESNTGEADPNLTWSLNGTTAELKGMLVAGYTLGKQNETDAGNNKITYTPENSGHVFATLTGLKSGITAGDLEGIKGISSASDTEITLDSRVLGTDPVLLDDVGVLGTSMGYELVPDTTDDNYAVSSDSSAEAHFWTVNNGTATYKSATEAYYTPDKQDENDTVNNKIIFTARDTANATTLATLTGLKSGLTVVDDKIAGIDGDGSTFTISRDVLGTSNVTIDSESGPTFTLADGTAPEQDGGYYWTVEGSTAYYQFKSTAGYTQGEDPNADIIYQAAKSGNNANTVAQITGLKSGINKAAVESNIDVSESGNEVTFTLNEAVLGTTNVTLAENDDFKSGIFYTDGTSYVLDLDSSVAAPDNNKAGWDEYDATNKVYTLKNYTTAGYKVDTDNGSTTIVYTPGSLGNAIATVTGLKAGLTPNASTAQIAGIDIDYDNDKLILSANVLQKDKDTNVAIEADPDASDEYALDLATTVATPAYTKAWAIKSGTGTATLTQEMSEGYINDGGEIVYKPKETVTTTISGLSSNVKVSDDKQKIGIQSGTTFSGITTPSDDITSSTATTKVATHIPTSGKITLHKDALAGNATVTVATRNTNNTADYTLADFTGGQDLVTPTTAHWVKAANSTTATYQTETAQGYSRTDDHKITYYSNASGTPTVTATLKGLAKGTLADGTTEINGAYLDTVIGDPTTPTDITDPTTGEVTGTNPGVFTITNKSIFGKNNVTLTATDYVMNFTGSDSAFANADITNENAYWTYDGKNGKASLVAGTTGGWTFKTTTKNNETTTDYKTIVYTAAKPVTIATVTGLAKNTTYKPISVTTADGKSVLSYGTGAEDYSLIATFSSGDGTKTAATTTTTNKAAATILVDKGILTTETQTGSNPVVSSNTTVSVSSKAGYEFTLKADGDVYTPKDSDKYWTVDNKGNAYYKYDTSAGYTPNAAGTSLVYSAEKSGSKATVIAKISGLDKTARSATADGVKLTEIDGIRITAPVEDDPSTTEVNEATAGVFTLWNKDILTNKVTLSVTKGQPDYNLGVDEQIATADGGTKWYFKNGTATYREYRTAGYELNAKNSKLVESKGDIAGKTYVTISGLAKSTTDGTTTTAITEDRIKNESLIIVNADKTITLSDKIQGKTTITLANAVETAKTKTTPAVYYDYTIDPNSYTTNARVVNDPEWTVANGTATLKQTTGAGFTLGSLNTNNGKQALTYSKESTATLATVKGLANNFAVLTDAQATKYNTANAAAITARTLNAVTEGTFYTVSTETINNKKVTAYTAAADLLSYNADKIITVSNNALASKNVTVSGKSGYTLALGGDVTKNRAETTTGWVVNGTTANYKDYVQDYYSLNTAGTTITYTKPKDIKVYATVTGLAKDSEIDSTNWSGTKEGGVLTLTAANLGTSTIKIASKVAGQDTFLLALASDADTQAKLSTATNAGTWTLKNGTYTLSNNITVGFTQDFGGKTLTYNNKANKAVTVATVTGLNSKAKTSDISVSGDGIITLSADALTNKNVAVTTNWGDTNYKLALAASADPAPVTGDNSTATGEAGSPKDPSATKVPGWTISGSKGTLKGYIPTASYTLSESGKSITYTGATATTKKKVSGEETYFYKDTATLATITGLKTTADKSGLLDGNNTINLTSANTNGNLTLNTGVFAVEVDSSYAGKTITGSAGADDLTVNAAGKTITGGKGDDKIDLGSGGSNTFVYNNGDGHDVIANFEATDKLQVNSGAVSVGTVDGKVVVKVGAGSINLGSYNGDTIDIYAKDGKTKTTYAIQGEYTGATGSPNPLLVDDNYSMNAVSLSDLVQPDSASFTPYDFDGGFSLTKEDKLTPAISYNNSDKK